MLFFGIIMRMYFDDHPPAHFHASYQAFVAIDSGEIIRGSLPKKAARVMRQGALDHRGALMANWQRGVDLLPMEMTPEADLDD